MKNMKKNQFDSIQLNSMFFYSLPVYEVSKSSPALETSATTPELTDEEKEKQQKRLKVKLKSTVEWYMSAAAKKGKRISWKFNGISNEAKRKELADAYHKGIKDHEDLDDQKGVKDLRDDVKTACKEATDLTADKIGEKSKEIVKAYVKELAKLQKDHEKIIADEIEKEKLFKENYKKRGGLIRDINAYRKKFNNNQTAFDEIKEVIDRKDKEACAEDDGWKEGGEMLLKDWKKKDKKTNNLDGLNVEVTSLEAAKTEIVDIAKKAINTEVTTILDNRGTLIDNIKEYRKKYEGKKDQASKDMLVKMDSIIRRANQTMHGANKGLILKKEHWADLKEENKEKHGEKALPIMKKSIHVLSNLSERFEKLSTPNVNVDIDKDGNIAFEVDGIEEKIKLNQQDFNLHVGMKSGYSVNAKLRLELAKSYINQLVATDPDVDQKFNYKDEQIERLLRNKKLSKIIETQLPTKVVIGEASFDGGYALNEKLANRRALKVANNLKRIAGNNKIKVAIETRVIGFDGESISFGKEATAADIKKAIEVEWKNAVTAYNDKFNTRINKDGLKARLNGHDFHTIYNYKHEEKKFFQDNFGIHRGVKIETQTE